MYKTLVQGRVLTGLKLDGKSTLLMDVIAEQYDKDDRCALILDFGRK